MSASPWHRPFFLFAAAFNFVVAAGLGLAREAMFRLLAMPAPVERITYEAFVGVVFLFGLAFLWISLDPARHRDLIALGAAAKLGVFVHLAWHHLVVGDASARMLLLVSADLAFAIVFLAIWWRLGEMS